MEVSTKQQRIAMLAKQSKDMSFTSLSHHIDINWLEVAFRAVRKDSAPGSDGETVETYAENLEVNLKSLLNRAKSGDYFAPPVRRVHIPKGGNPQETRPIGIPTVEDKILQRAVVMVLEPIYEQDFLNCSYGFRRGRSAHQALEVLRKQSMQKNMRYILDVDISKFFDTLEHAQLQTLLKRRVRDGVITRLVGKWLNAGVIENGRVSYVEEGTPQGGVIFPLLSNIYLHYVLDEWFELVVKPRLKGRAYMVRFADDVVMGFEHQADAEKVVKVLGKRFGKYGLAVHPEKTRLVSFERPTGMGGKGQGTFDFLGFTHYWSLSRNKNWVVKQKTMSKRLTRAIKITAQWCRNNRHLPIAEQHKKLLQKLQGHYAYYGITGNSRQIACFREEVLKRWQKWLHKRSRESSDMPWEKFRKLMQYYVFPSAKAIHSVYVAKP